MILIAMLILPLVSTLATPEALFPVSLSLILQSGGQLFTENTATNTYRYYYYYSCTHINQHITIIILNYTCYYVMHPITIIYT